MVERWFKIKSARILKKLKDKEWDIEQCGLWTALCCLANENDIIGKISIKDNIGMTDEQILKLFGDYSKDKFKEYTEKFQKKGSLSKDMFGVWIINNWKEHNTDWQNKKEYPSQVYVKKGEPEELFSYWNEQKIMVHKHIEPYMSTITVSLKRYSMTEIKEAINNFREILEGKEYRWSYRWTLKEFLQRGLDKFLTSSKPKENYKMGGKENGIRRPKPNAKW